MEKLLKKKNRKIKKSLEEKLVWGACSSLVVLFGLYGFFMNATVLNIVGAEHAQAKENAMNAKVSKLQYRYVQLTSGLDMAYAEQLGLHRVEDPQYALRQSEHAFAFAK